MPIGVSDRIRKLLFLPTKQSTLVEIAKSKQIKTCGFHE